MDDGALIQYKNVEIHQQELCVLSDVNLELHKGEFVYLIGKVGSGKTSLLKTLYGELDVIDGEAEVLGYNMRSIKRKHIPQLRRKLGIVFQYFQLLTDRTVYNLCWTFPPVEALLQYDPVSPVCFSSLWHEAQIPGYYIQYGL